MTILNTLFLFINTVLNIYIVISRLEADGKLYVKYEVIGKNNVSVPTHFFKVVVIENDKGEFEMNSFVIPNQSFPENTPLKNFLVPVETIERASGFLLFDGVPKNRLRAINGKKTWWFCEGMTDNSQGLQTARPDTVYHVIHASCYVREF